MDDLKEFFENLYKFKKDSWHVKLYIWLFDVNPVHKYKTMCPYFWTYVLIMLGLPFLLLFKAAGKYGNQALTYAEGYKENKKDIARKKFLLICSNVDSMTAKEAYDIKCSKCFIEHHYWLDYDVFDKIIDLQLEEEDRLSAIERAKKAKRYEAKQVRTEQFEVVKESVVFEYISYAIFGAVALLILWVIGKLIWMIPFATLPYAAMGIVSLWVIGILTAIFLLYLLVVKIILPFFEYLSCITLPECVLCKYFDGFWDGAEKILTPFIYIGKGLGKMFTIIVDMVSNTYKKQCPIITWED